ncbi:hypothetical protein M427DRAFT_52144 [Gonapodya prolifera JEL478]|uniref:Zinc-finger domain-containing protein n=1 Tax=Gonapodya prolifera (strain JEL478) TaxID=1344416 RepID=A0A139AV14_GONPJ|nr:hypothetical protein M427DRAFT_52144 [Gonapodya prolifera JEL478]|eukprot:KXS20547.1 hypothetical protein M427DRAFT_52144 [Gonapodya prolifera JEL478]
MEEDNEYLRLREERLRQNRELLASLAIPKLTPITPISPPATPKSATIRAPRTPRSPLEELPRRQSDRQRGKSYNWDEVPQVVDDLVVDREGGGKVKKYRKSGGGRRSDLGVRVVGGRIYDSVNGESCHQCRQKTLDPKIKCTNKIVYTYADGTTVTSMCTLMLDEQCLKGRYGQTIADAMATGDWHCPKCQGICNCSFCRRKKGKAPTGILKHTALAAGYSSVADYLEALEKSRSRKIAEKTDGDITKKESVDESDDGDDSAKTESDEYDEFEGENFIILI